VSCLLQQEEKKHVPRYIYRFDFDKSEGSYSFHSSKSTEYTMGFLTEFKFMSDYLPSPDRYLYWQRNDVTLGRPGDSLGNFNLKDNKEEALMLFHERYRYDIRSGELQMIRRGFSSWDRGEAGKIQYWQSNAKWKCTSIE
jgi:hypothetical protein